MTWQADKGNEMAIQCFENVNIKTQKKQVFRKISKVGQGPLVSVTRMLITFTFCL